MDKKSLHDLLESAAVSEPPIGAMPQNVLRAATRLRRRRRTWYASAGAAAVAVACAAALTLASGTAPQAATPGSAAETVYVLGDARGQGVVTPVSAATDTPGQPVVVARGSLAGSSMACLAMVATPDGKTIWATDGTDTVTAISTTTHQAEKTITVVHARNQSTEQLLANPDGKTVYVLDSLGTVTPISTATDQPGTPIRLGWAPGGGDQMAITPDGKTLYVLKCLAPVGGGNPGHPNQPSVSYVIPIDTATAIPGAPIRVSTSAIGIMVTPNGRTAYVIGYSAAQSSVELTPIATATNTPGRTVRVGRTVDGGDLPVISPDGQTLYFISVSDLGIPDYHSSATNGVIPFSTVTNTPGKMISLGRAVPLEIVISPDGRALYVITRPGFSDSGRQCPPSGAITPISTVTGTAGNPIQVGCQPADIAITRDGNTAYVASTVPDTFEGSLTPMATSTNQPGKTITVAGSPVQVLIAP